MRKVRLIAIILLIVGITLTVLYSIPADNNIANDDLYGQIAGFDGTMQSDGCYGEPLNCYTGKGL